MKLEKLLDMKEGYVLDFTNSEFERFILDNVGINIYDDYYCERGNSKANRLRVFWNKESNWVVKKLLLSLFEYIQFKDSLIGKVNKELLNECYKIAEKLGEDNITINNLDSINDENFDTLSLAIADSIMSGLPVLALDKLHTYMMRYIRKLCLKHDIEYSNNESLSSCYGKYIKKIYADGLIESEMTKTILNAERAILDKFNYVRNNESFAHDNEVLNSKESMFIYKSIVNIINFINGIEEYNI